jgi:pimeloyl-ACP methyl ester carboxylesterase
VVLVAPACLDPREDPGAYEREEVKSSVAAENKPETSFLEALVPEDVRARIALETRFATFRAVSNLPDAFGLPGVAKMVDGRDMVEAVVGQMHPRMRANELRSRVEALAEKYTKPTQEFANVWDRALLNVYRADQPSPVSLPNAPIPLLSGRALLLKAKETALQLRTEFLVVTGDSDFVVPVRASRLVAELLGTPSLVEMAETGHLPMDERPEELGKILVGFIRGGVAGASTG